MQAGLTGGLQLSDDDPADVGDTAAPGDGVTASRRNHVHEVPIDNTLEFNASDELAVNVQDVIEHLQEHIQYHTASNNYSSDAGATVGQAYATSQYRKIITKVEVLLNPLVGADAYLVRLDELNADNSIAAKLFTSQTRNAPFGLGVTPRAFTFHDADGDVGVVIEKGIRLGILISRLGDNSDSAVAAVHGAEVSAGPRESYDDASTDFELENGVVYQHIDPAIGASTHSHDTQIRGNIKIFYTLILDHGNLVGDGNVNAGHIDSGSAADGEVLTADGSGGAAWEAATGGGGGALTQATEAALGGVRGATALQAIASSGTTILGWTNNRLRQFIAAALPPATAAQAIAATGTDRLTWTVTRLRELVTAALPTMTQTDIDNTTTDRKAVTGELIAANAGGAPPELDQDMVEDATDETFGTVSGQRLAQAIAAGNAGKVDGFSFVSATQAEYDALTPDANTVYLVTA